MSRSLPAYDSKPDPPPDTTDAGLLAERRRQADLATALPLMVPRRGVRLRCLSITRCLREAEIAYPAAPSLSCVSSCRWFRPAP